jgi:hypothetical protein
MSETLGILLASAVINGAVTWGVVSTKLEWMRRDLDALAERMAWLERQR